MRLDFYSLILLLSIPPPIPTSPNAQIHPFQQLANAHFNNWQIHSFQQLVNIPFNNWHIPPFNNWKMSPHQQFANRLLTLGKYTHVTIHRYWQISLLQQLGNTSPSTIGKYPPFNTWQIPPQQLANNPQLQ